ncbi:MAG: hypothetical protein ABI693_09550 [Bryobacteraceae bacterium]
MIPLLVVVSMFSYFAARYEPLLAGIIALGTVIVVVWAIRRREYSWAVALLTIIVAFSPHFLETKIFLLIGIACIVTATMLLATFQLRPLAEV